jgi:hypothetical protein
MEKIGGAERTSGFQIAVLALIVVVFIAALVFLPGISRNNGAQPPSPGQQSAAQNGPTITTDEFQSSVMDANRVAIVMDVRQAPDQAAANAILQCGVNLASSVARINKTVDSYAYAAGDLCYASDGRNASVADCEKYRTANYSLIVAYGPTDTKFYSSKALIFTNENYGASCFLALQAPQQEATQVEVDPNATLNVANMTPGQIFGTCSLRSYCLNLTGADAQQSCLKNSALQTFGDPRCCFGLANQTERNSCVISTAGVSHGLKNDYCQFLPQADAARCYYSYATGWLYSGYCDRIAGNSTLKADCYVALAKAGKLPGQITQNMSINSTKAANSTN